jgi:Domain of unknown function (DUF4158)
MGASAPPPLRAQLTLPFGQQDEAPSGTTLDRRRMTLLLQSWTPETLARLFLLTPTDLAQVQRCRGTQNRLGFALQLVLLRALWFAVPSLDLVPDPIVRFVSLQLGVAPTELEAYGQRPQTRDDHAAQIRSYLEVHAYTAADGDRLLPFLIQRALHRDDPAVLLDEAEDWLRQQGILFPSVRTLQRLIGQARATAEDQVHATIVQQLSSAQITALDALLKQPHGKRGFVFAWLKEPPRTASSRAIQELLGKLQAVRAVGVDTVDLRTLNRTRVQHLARLGRSYFATALQRFGPDKRHALLVCTLQDLQEGITDDIVAMLDVLIGRLFAHAEEEMEATQVKHGKTINTSLHAMRQAAAVLSDRRIPDADVRQVAFTAVSEELLRQAVDDAARTLRPEDYNHLDFVAQHYPQLRTFLPAVLAAIPLSGI